MELRNLTEEKYNLGRELFKLQLALKLEARSEEKRKEIEKKINEVRHKIAQVQIEINSSDQIDGQLSIDFDDSEQIKKGR
ncbi:MAG: hypothetical protein ACI4WW_03280 [Candidatus Coprovivens sp.]